MYSKTIVPVLISVMIGLLSTLLAHPAGAQDYEIKNIKPIEQVNPLATIINIQFPGGTITEYVKLIEKSNDVKANVIVSKEAADVMLPPFQLHSVTISDAIMAIEKLQVIGDMKVQVNGSQSTLVVIAAKKPHTGPQIIVESRVFEARNLLTQKLKIVDVVTAIKATWEMMDILVNPQVKYHEETQLILVVGCQKAIRAAENVLQELYLKRHVDRMSDVKERIEGLEAKIADLEKANKTILLKLAELKRGS